MIPSLVTPHGWAGSAIGNYIHLSQKVCNHSMSDITVQFQFFNFEQLYHQFLSHQGSFF